MTEKEQLEEMIEDLRIISNITMHYVILIKNRLREIRLEDIRNNPEKYTYWEIKRTTLTEEEKGELLQRRKERKRQSETKFRP